nr:DNA cytosine methyltransferase [Arthrospira sp. SH-MAG29]
MPTANARLGAGDDRTSISSHCTPNYQNMKYSVLDTFAGAGGFSLGFQWAGAHIIGAIEIDEWAGETFQFNHPNAHLIKGDIKGITDEKILDTFGDIKPHIILGGIPCQGFSICNQNKGDRPDSRNYMFQDLIRISSLLQPEIIIIENVPNLIKAKITNRQLVIDLIMSKLRHLGYQVNYQILNATDYGIPQVRKRLFILAHRCDITHPFPQPTHTTSNQTELFTHNLNKCPSLWEAISDLPDIEAGEGAEEMEYNKSPDHEYQQILRNGSDRVFNHKAMKHSQRLVQRFASMGWGDSTSDVPNHLRPLKRNSHQFSDKIYDQNNRRMSPYKPCNTIPASFYANFVHPYKNRNFTAREGARIQSFPDWYVFKGKPTVVSHKLLEREGRLAEKHLCQYNQIGNAVPPLMAKAIAENLFKQL